MAYRIAINGFGRIGRAIVRAMHDRGLAGALEIVAINDTIPPEPRAHLLKYDSVHGAFPGDVHVDGGMLHIDDRGIRLLSEPSVSRLPWRSLGIDLVMDCSGLCHRRDDALLHIEAGASRVLLSYPGPAEVDRTVVYGVNHGSLAAGDMVVSNASCTSNCLIPVLKAMDDAFIIRGGMITTIHSAMNDQPVSDGSGRGGLRRSRSGLASIVPIETHLAEGVARVLPGLAGRLKALSLRVPVMNVSALDISLLVSRETSAGEVNDLIEERGRRDFCGVMGLERMPLVSCDFRHDARSAVVDAGATVVSGGTLVRLLAWFDNEWGYALRMCDTACAMLGAGGESGAGTIHQREGTGR